MIVKYFIEVNLAKMKKELYFNMMQQVYNCLVKDNALGDRHPVQQEAFKSAFRRLDEAILTSRKSLLTPDIQRLDTQRVQEWKILNSATRESMKLPDQATADSADFVMSLIRNHGEVPNLKVNERSGALTNLSQDLTEKYAPQVAAIGLTGRLPYFYKLRLNLRLIFKIYADLCGFASFIQCKKTCGTCARCV